MAGCPAAPRFIVPEGDILDNNAILNENYNITLLAHELVDTLTIRWCARNRLLESAMMVKLSLSKWMSLNISTGNTTVPSEGKVTGSSEASSEGHATASLLLSRTVPKLL